MKTRKRKSVTLQMFDGRYLDLYEQARMETRGDTKIWIATLILSLAFIALCWIKGI